MVQGDVPLTAQRGEALPEGVGLDATGPTDPRALLDGGGALPFGGYKGGSIAFGALTDACFGYEDGYPGRRLPRPGKPSS